MPSVSMEEKKNSRGNEGVAIRVFALTFLHIFDMISLMKKIIDPAKLRKLAALSRLGSCDDELEGMVTHLNTIIEHAESLQAVNTDDVKPCHCVLEEKTLLMRSDEPDEPLERQEFLDNCPDSIGGMVRVPDVMKNGEGE